VSRADLEWAILGTQHALNPDEVRLDDLVPDERFEECASISLATGLEEMATHADPTDAVQRYWLARTLVEAVHGYERTPEDTRDVALPSAMGIAAVALLSPYRLGDPDAAANDLLQAIARLQPGKRIGADAVELLGRAFGDAVRVEGRLSEPQFLLRGTAADLATMVLELATNDLTCDSSIHNVQLPDGRMGDVVFVEVDACTNRTFDDCKGSISPLAWPDANPFFVSVTPLGPPVKNGADWSGNVKEVVGPGINGKYYETDLKVTYLEQKDLAITAFDLADRRTDPGKVTVDRGFLSLTDEGTHRRIRVLKVYRIEDLKTPPSWICPLWSAQLALSTWWGAL
jgi:hypothetical protein